MNLNLLKIFYLAARHGNLSAAARDLNITQPAVTKGIQRLQEQYDLRFINRFGKKMALTDAGEALYGVAQKIFEMERFAEESIREFQQCEKGHIRVHASESFGAYYLPSPMTPFCKANPLITLSVSILPSELVVEKVIALESDLGFISYPIGSPKLVLREILEDRLVLIVPPGHPITAKRLLDPRDLEDHPMIVHEPGSAPRQALEKLVRVNKLSLTIPLELSSNRAIKEAVENGLGIALISRKVVQEEIQAGRLVEIPLTDKTLTRKFYLVHHRDKYISEPLGAFIDRIDRWARCYMRSIF